MTQASSPVFDRGGKYFYLTALRSNNPTTHPTTIRHPTPCDGDSDDGLDFSTKDDSAGRTEDATPRAKAQFFANATPGARLNRTQFGSSNESRRLRDPIRKSSKSPTPSIIPNPIASLPTHPKSSLPSEIKDSKAAKRTSFPDPSSLFSGDLPDLTSSDDSSDSSYTNDTDQKGNTGVIRNQDLRKQISSLPINKASMRPINLKVDYTTFLPSRLRSTDEQVSEASPYDLPRKLTVYNSKTPQTWFYDRQKHPIPIPPAPARSVKIPFNSIYVCDIIDSQGNCSKRQVWINAGEEKVHWVGADKTHAVMKHGGSTYIAYVNDEGPHWVKKETWQKYKKAHVPSSDRS